jgi:hypothetical protein
MEVPSIDLVPGLLGDVAEVGGRVVVLDLIDFRTGPICVGGSRARLVSFDPSLSPVATASAAPCAVRLLSDRENGGFWLLEVPPAPPNREDASSEFRIHRYDRDLHRLSTYTATIPAPPSTATVTGAYEGRDLIEERTGGGRALVALITTRASGPTIDLPTSEPYSEFVIRVPLEGASLGPHFLAHDLGADIGHPRGVVGSAATGIAETTEGTILVPNNLDGQVHALAAGSLTQIGACRVDLVSGVDLGPIFVTSAGDILISELGTTPWVYQGRAVTCDSFAAASYARVRSPELFRPAMTGAAPWGADPRHELIGLTQWTDQTPAVLRARIALFDSVASEFLPGSVDVGFGVLSRMATAPDGTVYAILPWAGELIRISPSR